MRKKISSEAIALSSTYVLFFTIFLITGSVAFFLVFNEPDETLKDIFILYGCFTTSIGVAGIFLSYLYIPYCYQLEIEQEKIYISKNEVIILSSIKREINLNLDELSKIDKKMLGIFIFHKDFNLVYLHFKEATIFGKYVAVLMEERNYIILKGLIK